MHRFPKSEEVDQGLVFLSLDRLENESDKIQVLEELFVLSFPLKQLHGYGMDKLFDAYAKNQTRQGA